MGVPDAARIPVDIVVAEPVVVEGSSEANPRSLGERAPPRARSNRVNEIDLLRFLAAIAVVLYHYTFRGYAADARSIMPYPLLAPIAKYGYLGVELFFMISGFVILMTASRGGLRSFFASRVARLYPAFWVCCTITFVTLLAVEMSGFSASFPQYMVNLTMLSGFVGVESIDGVYWSLFVEIKFYVLIALLLALGRIHQIDAFLAIWLVASFAMVVIPAGALARVLLTDYSAYFIAGSVFYLIWSRGFSTRYGWMLAGSWLLAVWSSTARLPELESKFVTEFSIVTTVLIVTTLFVVMALVAFRVTGFLGKRRWMILGALTYPLYLLHQNIGYIIFNLGYPHINAHVLLAGTICLMIVLAYAVHVVFEKPAMPKVRNGVEHGVSYAMSVFALRAGAPKGDGL